MYCRTEVANTTNVYLKIIKVFLVINYVKPSYNIV